MERAAWTDERMDDLARRMDAGFERVDRDVRDLRLEMRQGLAGLSAEMDQRFVAMEQRFDGLGQRFDALQTTLIRIGGAMIVGLLGTIVAVSIGGS